MNIQERLREYWLGEPGRVLGYGKFVLDVAFGCFVSGVFGRILIISDSGFWNIAKSPQVEKTLADLFPSLAVWWVPESWFGFLCVALLTLFGVWLVNAGRNIDRLHKIY